MRIASDLDDVLLGYLPALIEYHNKVYGTQLKLEDFKSYDLWETWGGTREEAIKKVYDFYRTDYFRKMVSIPNSQEIVKFLARNNELFIITARQKEIEEETKLSIEKHFPNCFREIYFSSSYSLTGCKRKDKKYFCNLLNADILIEDSLSHSLDCIDSKRRIFLMDRPWNKCNELPEDIQRVNCWKDIIKVL